MALTKITGQVINDTTGLVVGVTTVGGGVSATDGFFSGIVTAVGDASFSGNVSVGGTLTYEDVTNIDAVGLVTARNGIVVGSGITLSKDGDIFATGVTTSTTFSGSGANLTNLPAANLTGTLPALDGSNLTGVASTENIRTNTNATFLQNINVSGSTTTGSLVSSGAISGTTGTFTGDVDIADKIVHTGDTNTAIRFPAADTVTVETGGTERFRITSDGDVGINRTSPAANLDIASTSEVAVAIDGWSAIGGGGSSNLKIGGLTGSQYTRLDFYTGGSERIRIKSDGSVLIGRTTDAFVGSLLQVQNITVETDADTTGMYFNRTDAAEAWVAMRFYVQGNQKGYIQVNTGSVTYSTSSDYRLKENVVSISDGIARLKTLKPYKFNFIADATKTVDGFFAHEVTAVPEAVSGEKDAVDEDGNPDYQVIDHSKLVPLLTAALQEAVTEIESLKARLDAAGL